MVVKRPERGVNYPPLSSAEVKERVDIPPRPLYAFMADYRAKLTFTLVTVTFKFVSLSNTLSVTEKKVLVSHAAGTRRIKGRVMLKGIVQQCGWKI